MDIEMIMKLIQDNPELAQAMVSQLKGQGQQAQGELGTVANMPDDVRQGMGDIYSSPDMQKLMGEQRDMATARSKQPVGAGVGPYNAYVAPHWTQNLNAAGAQGREGMMQQKMMADLLRKKAGADKYNQYAQDQAKALMAQQQAAVMQQQAQANEGIPGDQAQMVPDPGSGSSGQDMWHGEGAVPTVAPAPQDMWHGEGQAPPAAPGQNMTRRPRGYVPMPWEQAGPPRGNPWEE
jgi:hypothetical protein